MNRYPADRIRNVGLFSHGGAGKTSLVEAFAYVSARNTRLGSIEDGTTVSDFDPDEIQRRMSISTSVVPIEWEEHKLNILDVPGTSDFDGEVHAAMRVVDGAVILIDASAGVEVGTEHVWKLADKYNLPRLIFLNKMNRENADFTRSVDSVREAFGKSIAPTQFPIGAEREFKGVVDLLTNTAMVFHDNSDGGYEVVPIPDSLADDVATNRRYLVESIAEHNETLMTRYLEDEEISDEELFSELRACITDGSVIPMLCGATEYTRCIQPLMSMMVKELPAASARTDRAMAGDAGTVLTADPDGPLAALAFKTVADPHVGRVSYFRVFSGTLRSHSHVTNGSTGDGERIGQLFIPSGKDHLETDEIEAGDIGGVSKLTSLKTGHTLCDDGKQLEVAEIELPRPVYSAAVHPRSKADLDKLSQALGRLHEEDPTLVISRDPGSGETIVSGLGEPHVKIALDRMSRRSGVNVDLALPRVAYRETITTSTVAEYKHKKQTGGAGQYGHVFIRLEPFAEDDFAFDDAVVGGSVPRNYFPAVEKGVREGLESGPIAGFPVVNVKAVLTDGSYHNVDSNEMAFRTAAREAFRKGIMAAGPTLLEPISTLKVSLPDSYMGDVMSDLNTKRAHVIGIDAGEPGVSIIEALVPAAEVQRYATDLRSITQGRGTHTVAFATYQPVPSHLVEGVKAAHDKADGHSDQS